VRQRRLAPRSIAKVNAQSIGGYFGEGTSCFFIRGTILSDTPINGDYPTLNFMRDGNIIELSWFDGSWAAVTIQTRPGNRPGDNVTAKMYLRDDDLKQLGIDCTRIVTVKGLPFSFDVEALKLGLFGEHEPWNPIPPEPEPPAAVIPIREVIPEIEIISEYEPEPEPEPEIAYAAQPEPEPEPVVEPVALEPEPEPEPEVVETVAVVDIVEEPAVIIEQLEPVLAAYVAAEPNAKAPTAFDVSRFLEAFRSGNLSNLPIGKNPALEIGVASAVVGIPVLAYLFVEFMKNRSSDDKPKD
jgi:hypothetical protein